MFLHLAERNHIRNPCTGSFRRNLGRWPRWPCNLQNDLQRPVGPRFADGSISIENIVSPIHRAGYNPEIDGEANRHYRARIKKVLERMEEKTTGGMENNEAATEPENDMEEEATQTTEGEDMEVEATVVVKDKKAATEVEDDMEEEVTEKLEDKETSTGEDMQD
ncbi:unnamed protein product [Allacma fusca]|uniref:Uncharacterized protein n=1 Tax=Allacma fusca TaxID=39272 RepID=A0A8J2L6Y7_9HEXA|nr:unnamed protein product [Allacma fusca]